MIEQPDEFLAKRGIGFEESGIVVGSSCRILLLYATHLHAEMFSCATYNHSFGWHRFFEKMTNLRGETFLHLKPSREIIYYARKF